MSSCPVFTYLFKNKVVISTFRKLTHFFGVFAHFANKTDSGDGKNLSNQFDNTASDVGIKCKIILENLLHFLSLPALGTSLDLA